MILTTILLLVVLAGFLVRKELVRPARQHRWLRIASSLIALMSLAALLIPPTYTVTGNSDTPPITMLTPGYDQDSLATTYPQNTYTTDPALSGKDIAYIPDIIHWLDRQPSISNISLYGNGLDTLQLRQLQARKIAVRYHAPVTPAGFTVADWPRQLSKGSWLEVQGQYHNPASDTARIVLMGVGTRLDSAIVPPNTQQTFSVRCKPQHLGPSLYTLEASIAGKLQASEKLPVVITQARPMQVLLVNASPDFDSKFLATWLHDNQYQVAVRSTISQNKYSKQFLNQPAASLQTITPSLLKPLDVFVIDAAALAALSPGEVATIRHEVQQGMGLILQADSSGKDRLTAGLRINKQPGSLANPRTLHLPAINVSTVAIQPAQWLSIEPQPLVQPLVTDDQGAIVTAATLLGAGKVVLNTIDHTYSWVLGGHQADYARFWTILLQKATRRPAQPAAFQSVTDLPTAGYPVRVTIGKATPGLPQLETPDGRIAMAQHPWLSNLYTGTWWPVQAGWQTMRQGEDSAGLYIFAPSDWAAAKATASISANLSYSAMLTGQPSSKPAPRQQQQRAVPPVIFWATFIMCCSYLWWEEKRARAAT